MVKPGIFIRILLKNRLLSAISLIGLALGISSCIFISLFVIDEFTYDSRHENLDRIFRVTTKINSENSTDHVVISPSPVADAFRENFPEVSEAVRFMNMGTETTIKRGNLLFKEASVFKADSSVFRVFSYRILKGDPRTALSAPQRVVLTESIAKKYFSGEDPLGKTINMSGREFLVTGIMEDIPLNSDLRFPMLASMDSSDYSGDWFDFSYINYVMFDRESMKAPGFRLSLEKKIAVLVEDKINGPLREHKQSTTCTLHLQPLKGLHFQAPLLYDTPKGNRNYSFIFSSVAFLILIIACLNYINFSIVQSVGRSKEVGVRKVVGAAFSQLILRYIGESLFFTLLALLLAGAVTVALMPVFNELTDRNFTASDLLDQKVLPVLLSILFVVGILAGTYPAFFTSSIRTVQALKGKVATPAGQFVRKVSIGIQFFISIGLLICTGIVSGQMSFIKKYDLGFRKDNVLVITSPADSSRYDKFRVFKQYLRGQASVQSVALGGVGSLPGSPQEMGSITIRTDGKEDVRMVSFNAVDEDYLPSLGIGVVQGRNFDGRMSDFRNSVLVNEAFVKMMGWENPLAQQVSWKGSYRNVIGVVRDFHFRSLYNKVEPQLITHHGNEISHVFVAFSGSALPDRMDDLNKKWNEMFPDEPFDYNFLDETVNAQYRNEQKAMRVFTCFSALTIVISFLGLFGLTSLTVYQRKKEVGIRKIAGAPYISILVLFAREYVMLIIFSILLVSPLCWWVMSRWLESFPFRDSIDFSIFLATSACTVIVSFLTIAFALSRISTSKLTTLIGEQ